MPVAMLQSWEGFTKEMYEGISERVFGHTPVREDDAPDGLIVHSAGQGPGGWYVYDIWESREAFERFNNEKLMPAAMEMMGDQQPPPEAAPQFFEVEVLVVPR